jgi:hypothetical protein
MAQKYFLRQFEYPKNCFIQCSVVGIVYVRKQYVNQYGTSIFIFSFINMMLIEICMKTDKRVKRYRVFCVSSWSCNCMWAEKCKYIGDEIFCHVGIKWIWIASCELYARMWCTRLCVTTDKTFLLLIFFECACLVEFSELWHWIWMCNTTVIIQLCFTRDYYWENHMSC